MVLVFCNQVFLDLNHLIVKGFQCWQLHKLLFDPGFLLLSVLFETVNPLNVGLSELCNPFSAVVAEFVAVGSEYSSMNVCKEISPHAH